MKIFRFVFSIIFIIIMLASCGQRGDLVRPAPDEQEEKILVENSSSDYE